MSLWWDASILPDLENDLAAWTNNSECVLCLPVISKGLYTAQYYFFSKLLNNPNQQLHTHYALDRQTDR